MLEKYRCKDRFANTSGGASNRCFWRRSAKRTTYIPQPPHSRQENGPEIVENLPQLRPILLPARRPKRGCWRGLPAVQRRGHLHTARRGPTGRFGRAAGLLGGEGGSGRRRPPVGGATGGLPPPPGTASPARRAGSQGAGSGRARLDRVWRERLDLAMPVSMSPPYFRPAEGTYARR